VIARTQTIKWKTRIIKKYTQVQPTTILDYGCGTGDFLTGCKNLGWKVTGVEPSTTAREIAASKSDQTIYSDISEIPSTLFDAITLWHVLEHIPNLHDLIETLHSRLKQTGTIFIAVPNRNSWDAKHYKDNWAAYDVPRHLWHFTRQDIEKIMATHSLRVVDTIPMKLDAYYVSLLSEKYQEKKLGAITPIKAIVKKCSLDHLRTLPIRLRTPDVSHRWSKRFHPTNTDPFKPKGRPNTVQLSTNRTSIQRISNTEQSQGPNHYHPRHTERIRHRREKNEGLPQTKNRTTG
jgi:SAM-dependent methyltransferase